MNFERSTRAAETGRRHLWEIPAARDVISIIALALALWLVYALREIFIPLLIALLLAHVANPLITSLQREWRWPRPLTAGLLLIVTLLACSVFLAWLGPLLVEQITGLTRRLPDYIRALAQNYGVAPGNFTDNIAEYLSSLQYDFQQVVGQIFHTTGQALGLVTTAFSTLAYLFLSFALVFFYFFVFAWHFNSALRKLARYIPASRKERAVYILARMDEAIGHFFRGRMVVAIIMGILLSIGWFFSGVPYWFFLGMLTGFLNIIPYLSIVSWPIAVLLKYLEALTGGNQDTSLISIVLWPSAVYIAVQLLEGWLLTPWIQSSQTNLSAPAIIIVVFLGGSLAGVLGMLLAIPVAACVKILLDELVLPRLRTWATEN